MCASAAHYNRTCSALGQVLLGHPLFTTRGPPPSTPLSSHAASHCVLHRVELPDSARLCPPQSVRCVWDWVRSMPGASMSQHAPRGTDHPDLSLTLPAGLRCFTTMGLLYIAQICQQVSRGVILLAGNGSASFYLRRLGYRDEMRAVIAGVFKLAYAMTGRRRGACEEARLNLSMLLN